MTLVTAASFQQAMAALGEAIRANACDRPTLGEARAIRQLCSDFGLEVPWFATTTAQAAPGPTTERPQGRCGRTILSDGRRSHCVDCQLAAARRRFTRRVGAAARAAEAAR